MKKILRFFGGTIYWLLLTVAGVALTAYILLKLVFFGPSASFRNTVVRTLRESSAGGVIAELYFSPEELAEIEHVEEEVYVATDTSLIVLNDEPEEVSEELGPQPDAWGYIDEDNDGIILEEVNGPTFHGYMMIVLDRKRVIMGCDTEALGHKAFQVSEFCEKFDAVAAINAGGFQDPGGKGNGSKPDSLVVFKGVNYFEWMGMGAGFAGFDNDAILHVGKLSLKDVEEQNIRYGVCFGPALVVNGERQDDSQISSGLNPRTAIGQRSDGAVLLLVVEGRQATSAGATYGDLADVMMRFGAVNACNLDGGSSSLLWYEGKYVNNCASMIGLRPVPTSFVVLKEGCDGYTD